MQIHISTNAIEKCNVIGKLFRLRNITSSITHVKYLRTHFCIYEFPVKARQIYSSTITKSLYKITIKFFIFQRTSSLLTIKTKLQTDRGNESYASTEVKVLKVNHVSAHRYLFFLRVVCIQTGQVKRRRKFCRASNPDGDQPIKSSRPAEKGSSAQVSQANNPIKDKMWMMLSHDLIHLIASPLSYH